MKILHTSDRHIGRALYGRKQYDEYEAFLNWRVNADVLV
jgi:exonuclease SbcD